MQFFKSVRFMTIPVTRSICERQTRQIIWKILKHLISNISKTVSLDFKNQLWRRYSPSLAPLSPLWAGEEEVGSETPISYVNVLQPPLTFVVVPVAVGVVAFSINLLVLFITQVNASKDGHMRRCTHIFLLFFF